MYSRTKHDVTCATLRLCASIHHLAAAVHNPQRKPPSAPHSDAATSAGSGRPSTFSTALTTAISASSVPAAPISCSPTGSDAPSASASRCCTGSEAAQRPRSFPTTCQQRCRCHLEKNATQMAAISWRLTLLRRSRPTSARSSAALFASVASLSATVDRSGRGKPKLDRCCTHIPGATIGAVGKAIASQPNSARALAAVPATSSCFATAAS